MTSSVVEPRRLYRTIADQLRQRMATGEFPVGTRLPPERDLAAVFGVSRPTLREALIALEVEGLVEVRVGSGIHVIALEARSPARGLGDAFGPFEIIRARQVVEGELAALAARSMSAAQVGGLYESIGMMEEDARQGLVPVRGDRLFHLRIAQAGDNAPLLRAVTQWFDERNGPLFEQLGHHFENPANWQSAIAEHGRVIEAIAARAPQRARAAMQVHMQRSHDRFAAAWPQGVPPLDAVPEPDSMPVPSSVR